MVSQWTSIFQFSFVLLFKCLNNFFCIPCHNQQVIDIYLNVFIQVIVLPHPYIVFGLAWDKANCSQHASKSLMLVVPCHLLSIFSCY
jgi:hypothetical protein